MSLVSPFWNTVFTCDLRQFFCACYLCPRLGSALCGVAIRYVLPVLWMTSCLYIMTRNRRRNSDSLGSSMNLTPRHILKLTHQMSWTLISTIALFHSVSIDEVAPFHNVCCVSVAIKEEYLRPFVTPPSI